MQHAMPHHCHQIELSTICWASCTLHCITYQSNSQQSLHLCEHSTAEARKQRHMCMAQTVISEWQCSSHVLLLWQTTDIQPHTAKTHQSGSMAGQPGRQGLPLASKEQTGSSSPQSLESCDGNTCMQTLTHVTCICAPTPATSHYTTSAMQAAGCDLTL